MGSGFVLRQKNLLCSLSRHQACYSSSWSYYSLSLSDSTSQVTGMFISNHTGLCLCCDYRILEGNPVTEVYLGRWLKIWKSRNYVTKNLANISIHVFILRHHGNDVVVAVNWTRGPVNVNHVLYNLWQQSSTSCCHMEIWWVIIFLLQWTDVQITKGNIFNSTLDCFTWAGGGSTRL